jgi:hypothetical protein
MRVEKSAIFPIPSSPKNIFPPRSLSFLYLGTELADDDTAGLHGLAAVDLDAAALRGV